MSHLPSGDQLPAEARRSLAGAVEKVLQAAEQIMRALHAPSVSGRDQEELKSTVGLLLDVTSGYRNGVVDLPDLARGFAEVLSRGERLIEVSATEPGVKEILLSAGRLLVEAGQGFNAAVRITGVSQGAPWASSIPS